MDEYYFKLRKYLTPIKLAGLVLIVLGIVDNLTFSHPATGLFENQKFELIVRGIFIFCGFFALLSNGKSLQSRAALVSLPFFYLSVYYMYQTLIANFPVFIVPSIISGLSWLWLSLFGAHYEYK
jgi:hypothetical protein